MTTEELDQIEVSNQAAKKAVAKGEALKRLMETDDYKMIVVEGYLNEYAKELGMSIAQNTGAFESDKLFDNLKGINTFVGYTFQVAGNYHAAVKELADNSDYVANSDKE